MLIKYAPSPVCSRFHASNAEIRYIQGPVGSGKSTACVMEVFTRIREQQPDQNGIRKSRVAIIRNSYPILKETTVRTWLDWIPEAHFGPVKYSSPISHTINYKLPDGTTVDADILFLSLDLESDQKKLLSLEITFAWINEAKEIRKDHFDLVQTRVGRFPAIRNGGPTWSGVILDSNPPPITHWLHKVFVQQLPHSWKFFKQPSGTSEDAENIENLQAGYYKRISEGKTDDWIRVYVEGEFGFSSSGKPVHPAFEYGTHVAKEEIDPDPYMKTYVGIDFGLTPACVFIQYDSGFGRYIVTDELVTSDMSAREFASEIHRVVKRRYGGRMPEFWGDPAGSFRSQNDGETIFQLLWTCGIDARPVDTNNFAVRKSALDNLLTKLGLDGKPSIVISPVCHTLMAGLAGGYKFKKLQVSGDERFHEKPDKTHESHVCESLHYGLMGAGEGDKALYGTNSKKTRFTCRSLLNGTKTVVANANRYNHSDKFDY